MKSSSVIIAVIIILCSIGCNKKYTTAQLAMNKPAIYQVNYDGATIGTAFSYLLKFKKKEYSFLLTPAHVMIGHDNDLTHIRLENDDAEFIVTKFKVINFENDICILSTNSTAHEIDDFLTRGKEDFRQFSEIYSIGYSSTQAFEEKDVLLSSGFIQKVSKKKVLASMHWLNSGGSGSPAVDIKGQLIGMITKRYLNEEKKYYGFIEFTPVEKIDAALIDYLATLSNERLRKEKSD